MIAQRAIDRARALGETALLAVGALKANRIRAVLALLGITIGIAPVILTAGIIAGVRRSVVQDLDAAGPNNLIVQRFDISNLEELGSGRAPWAGRPRITTDEVRVVASLPFVRSATASVAATARAQFGNKSLSEVDVEGSGPEWLDLRSADLIQGRNFLATEIERSANVAAISVGLARYLFPTTDPVGEQLLLDGLPFRVVGVYTERAGLFSGQAELSLVAPYTATLKYLSADADWLEIRVMPVPGISRGEARDGIIAALRSSRKLPARRANDFEVRSQEEIGETFDKLSAMFFAVTVLLSGIGLIVGGAGVTAIMTISVTERTREIGIRKALGATRSQVRNQFLTESCAITAAGGLIGVATAVIASVAIQKLTPLEIFIPIWSAVVAVSLTALCGVGLGVYPASRAARLDPVVALRHE